LARVKRCGMLCTHLYKMRIVLIWVRLR
jgi:hypothetical protein